MRTYVYAGALVGCAMSGALAQQPDSGSEPATRSSGLKPPQARFELAFGLPSALVEDANGTTLRSGLAPLLGLAGTWMMSPRLQSAIGIRASTASLTADAGSADWKAGRTSQVGIRAALEQRFDVGLGVFVAGSGTWLMGPDDVAPFRHDAGWRWGGDAGVSWRAAPRQRIAVFLAIETFMLGGATTTDPIQATAWTRRVVIGARRGS